MKPQTLVRVEFKGLLKARCEPELEAHYRLTAAMRKIDMADLVREALRDYAPKLTTDRGLTNATTTTI